MDDQIPKKRPQLASAALSLFQDSEGKSRGSLSPTDPFGTPTVNKNAEKVFAASPASQEQLHFPAEDSSAASVDRLHLTNDKGVSRDMASDLSGDKDGLPTNTTADNTVESIPRISAQTASALEGEVSTLHRAQPQEVGEHKVSSLGETTVASAAMPNATPSATRLLIPAAKEPVQTTAASLDRTVAASSATTTTAGAFRSRATPMVGRSSGLPEQAGHTVSISRSAVANSSVSSRAAPLTRRAARLSPKLSPTDQQTFSFAGSNFPVRSGEAAAQQEDHQLNGAQLRQQAQPEPQQQPERPIQSVADLHSKRAKDTSNALLSTAMAQPSHESVHNKAVSGFESDISNGSQPNTGVSPTEVGVPEKISLARNTSGGPRFQGKAKVVSGASPFDSGASGQDPFARPAATGSKTVSDLYTSGGTIPSTNKVSLVSKPIRLAHQGAADLFSSSTANAFDTSPQSFFNQSHPATATAKQETIRGGFSAHNKFDGFSTQVGTDNSVFPSKAPSLQPPSSACDFSTASPGTPTGIGGPPRPAGVIHSASQPVNVVGTSITKADLNSTNTKAFKVKQFSRPTDGVVVSPHQPPLPGGRVLPSPVKPIDTIATETLSNENLNSKITPRDRQKRQPVSGGSSVVPPGMMRTPHGLVPVPTSTPTSAQDKDSTSTSASSLSMASSTKADFDSHPATVFSNKTAEKPRRARDLRSDRQPTISIGGGSALPFPGSAAPNAPLAATRTTFNSVYPVHDQGMAPAAHTSLESFNRSAQNSGAYPPFNAFGQNMNSSLSHEHKATPFSQTAHNTVLDHSSTRGVFDNQNYSDSVSTNLKSQSDFGVPSRSIYPHPAAYPTPSHGPITTTSNWNHPTYSNRLQTGSVSRGPLEWVENSLTHMKDARHPTGPPPFAIVAFGFGGKLATFFPRTFVPASPLAVTPADLERPYRPGKLMYKTLSTMLPFDKVGVDSADQPTKNAAFYSVGESMSNPKTIERDDTARKISLSLEMKHFLSLLIATKGPLLLPSFACRPGRKSSLSSQEEKEKQEEEASLLLFLEDCLARPLGKTLPKSYYRIRSNCEDVNAIIAKSSFTSKLLVSLLKLMITQTNGQTATATGCLQDKNSAETKIADLLINLQSSAELAGAQQEDHGKTAIDIDELPSIQRQIEELLVCGEREEALKLAIDSSEWALAMLIGCVCGQKEYQEVVRKFAAQSLPVDSPLHMISMMYSNQARGSILADSLLSQSISHNALISVVKEPNNASEASSLSVRTQRLQLSKSRIESADYEKSDEPTTSVWQEKLIALLANKGSDWKELFASFGYRTQLKSDLGNLAASHFVYLCGGIYPSNPVSKSAAIGDATTQGEAISRLRKKYIGNYTLLGCDISSSRHKSVADCVSVLGLRLTEILEWILSRRLLMLESTSQSSATNSSISKSLTGLFGWGDSSQSSFSSTKTVAETNQAELHSLKEELVRVRIVLAPLKIRFAFTLLDFGLFDSALKYVVEVRQLIADVASQAVSAASKNGSAARSVNVSKRPGDKAGAAKIPTKAFNEHFTRAVDELYDRLKGGASTAVLSNPTNSMHSTSNSEIPPRQSNGTNETTPSASQTQYPSTASGSAWGLAISSTVMSALSTTNLKDFVDGNAVDAHHGASRTAQVSNPSASYAYGASAVNTTPACGGAMSNNTTGDLHQQSSGAWFIGSTSPPESTGSSMPPSMYNQQSQGTGSFEGGGFSSSGFFATNELKDSLSMGYSQSQAIQQGPDGGRQHTDSATTVRVEEKHKDTKSANSSSAPASSGGLVKSVRKGLLNWLYPDAVDTSENMGNSLEAYFDKATGKWVFPGEDNSQGPDPASKPPPTSLSAPNLGTPSGSNSGVNLYSMAATMSNAPPGSNANSDSVDPLAALMAPPARRMPHSNSQQSMLSAGSNSSAPPFGSSTPGAMADQDPLAALMAPPMRGYSSYSNSKSDNNASGPPPTINVWKPAAAAPTPVVIQKEGGVDLSTGIVERETETQTIVATDSSSTMFYSNHTELRGNVNETRITTTTTEVTVATTQNAGTNMWNPVAFQIDCSNQVQQSNQLAAQSDTVAEIPLEKLASQEEHLHPGPNHTPNDISDPTTVSINGNGIPPVADDDSTYFEEVDF